MKKAGSITKIIIFCYGIIINFFVFYGEKTKAEGTKQLMPTSSSYGNIQIYDGKRPFAAYYNTDPNNRLYFHISNTSEKVYFGFKHITQTGINNSTSQFRIKDPSGNIVYASTNIPTSGNGYISSYSKAVAGPKINNSPSGGYSPLSLTPATTGDFYIEFQTDTSQGTYHIDYFDLTVVNSENSAILGRLWSYCWDLSTRSFDNGFTGLMYVLTDDGFVSQVNFNGIEPYGFTVACNSTGPGNSPDGNNENRKSVEGNFTRPQFKVFLNNPDINCYPSGVLPQVVQNLNIAGTPIYGKPVIFTLNISQPGVVQIVLDINGVDGYQTNTSDLILVDAVHAGLDSIVWDGKDGFGNYVTGNTKVLVTSSFASGTTHLPLYDPETFPNGYIVTRIRPSSGQCDLFWDDSNFSNGTVNIDGSLTTGHSWSTNFGNERTMNTWWNGYQLDVLNDFDFNINFALPVEIINFNAKSDNNYIDLTWLTASENNNDYFTIERSIDGINFELLANINGAGNSNTLLNYNYIDKNPSEGLNYYRLKQTDFNGDFIYSNIVSVNYSSIKNEVSVYPNILKKGCSINIDLPNESSGNYTATFYTLGDIKISEYTFNKSFTMPVSSSINGGFYYLVVASSDNKQIRKIVIQ